MQARSRAALVAAALATSGCATSGAPGYDTLRGRYERADVRAEEPVDDRLFTGPLLDRGEYVRAVLRRNRTIASARLAWRAALARVRQAGAFDDPMIDVGVAPLSVAGSSPARFGWQAGVSQKLPWFGKRGLETSVVAAEARVAEGEFEATRRELALGATTLYDQYFVIVRSSEVNAAHVELMRALQRAALAQYESGRGSIQDSLAAEAELTHMEHDAVILASHREVVVAQMNELLHRAPEVSLPPPPKDLTLAAAPDVRDPQRLQAEAVEHRPEIAAARQHARAEESRADRGERESYPDLTVSTSYNSMWDTPEHRWMVGLGVNLPIQTGRRAGAVEEANAARARYESEALRMADAARTEVVVALKHLEESEHVLRLHEERLVPIARQQVEAARAAFVASQSPFVAVVEAERNLRRAELDYAVARADHDRRRAELDRALGRVPGVDGKEGAP